MTKREATWVVLLPTRQGKAGPGTLACLRCGAKYEILSPPPISLFHAMSQAFDKDHRRCPPHPLGDVCTACWGRGHSVASCLDRSTATVRSPQEWLHGPDTGLSSITIYCVMTRNMVPLGDHGPRTPMDSDDLGRCVRLLDRFPEWRARIQEMDVVPGWSGLSASWAHLEQLYRKDLAAGNFSRTNVAIQGLLTGA